MAQQLKKKFIGNAQVDGDKIQIEAGQSIKAVDSTAAVVDLIKLDASDKVLVKGSEVALKAQADATDTALAQEILDRAAADQDLQDQIDFIKTNIDPAALDSLTEIVTAFQNADGDLTQAILDLGTSSSSALGLEEAARIAEDLTFVKLDGSRPMSGDLDFAGFRAQGLADGIAIDDAATKGQLDALADSIALDTTAFVKVDGSRAMTGDFNMGLHQINNLAAGTMNDHAVNKEQLDLAISAEAFDRSNADLQLLPLDGSRSMTSSLNMGLHSIISLADGTMTDHAVNKGQLDSAISNEAIDRTQADLQLLPLDGTRSMSGSLNMGLHEITSLANGTMSDHAVNKGQLDFAISSEAIDRAAADQQLLDLNGSRTMMGSLKMGNYEINGLAAGTMIDHAVNKGQMDSAISSEASDRAAADLQLLPLDGSRSMTGSLNMGLHEISGVSNGTMSDHAVNKGQLDTKLDLAGGTMSGPIAMGGHKVSGLAAPTANGDALRFDELGANNGIATLDAGGKIPMSMLPSTVMNYHETWDASTNTPALADGMVGADPGDVYIVSVAGTQDLGSGSQTFAVGDFLIYSQAGIWEWAGGSNSVNSVNGQTGIVVLDSDDVAEGVSNLYFTEARAQSAAVVNSTLGSETAQAPSVFAAKAYADAAVSAEAVLRSAADALKVDKAGDSMQGQLTMQSANVVVDYSTAGGVDQVFIQQSDILIQVDNGAGASSYSDMWSGAMEFAQADTVSGADALLSIGANATGPIISATQTDPNNNTSGGFDIGIGGASFSYTDATSGDAMQADYAAQSFAINKVDGVTGEIRNITADLTSGTIQAYSNTGSGPQAILPTVDWQLAPKKYVDDQVAIQSSAISAHLADTVDAHDASAISIAAGITNLAATDAQAAFAELQADVDGRAVVALSNLAATTAINSDLNFSKGAGVGANIRGKSYVAGEASGALSVFSGSVSGGVNSGQLNLFSGNIVTGTTGNTGAVDVRSGSVVDGTSGMANIHSGNASGNGSSGATQLYSGPVSGTGNSGVVYVESGPANSGNSGDVNIGSGTSSSGSTGALALYTSAVTGIKSSGFINVVSGDSVDGVSGQLRAASGAATGSAASGQVIFESGNVQSGTSGQAVFESGDSASGSSGALYIGSGDAAIASGDVHIKSGLGATRGKVKIHAAAEVDNAFTAFSTSTFHDQMDLQSHKIVNVADPASSQDAATKHYVDLETTRAEAAESALDIRVDVLESVTWFKQKFAISNGQTSITLSHTPVAGSMSAFVDRLAIHEGAAEDYTISGTTVTFLNDLVSPGSQQLGNGDTVYVKYQYKA